MTAACLNVYENSPMMIEANRDGNGDEVRKGTKEELISQMEKIKMEKRLIERSSETLEERNKILKKGNEEMTKKMRELEEEKEELKRENNRLKGQVRDDCLCLVPGNRYIVRIGKSNVQ